MIRVPSNGRPNDHSSRCTRCARNGFDSKHCIQISNLDEARKLRADVIKFIWKDDKIPSEIPALNHSSMHGGIKSRLRKINHGGVCEFNYRMSHGVNSLMYLYSPAKKSNNKLVIYNHGHHMSSFDFGERTIDYFLTKGYHVMGLCMPLTWPNNRTVNGMQYSADTFSHEMLGRLQTRTLCPIKFFLEPVHAAINLLDEKYEFDSYSMVGLSGGGWTTTLCAALDERISGSYSVAGSLPIELRTPRDEGDYEQKHPALYNMVNYLELYTLGFSGSNRKCVHVYNEHDPCCFMGRRYESYDAVLKKKSKDLGGYYKVYLDSSNGQHSISGWSLDNIHNEISASLLS